MTNYRYRFAREESEPLNPRDGWVKTDNVNHLVKAWIEAYVYEGWVLQHLTIDGRAASLDVVFCESTIDGKRYRMDIDGESVAMFDILNPRRPKGNLAFLIPEPPNGSRFVIFERSFGEENCPRVIWRDDVRGADYGPHATARWFKNDSCYDAVTWGEVMSRAVSLHPVADTPWFAIGKERSEISAGGSS